MSTVGQGAGYLVGGIAGFFIGGPSGAIYGAQIGGMIGGYLDPPKQKGNKPQSDLSVQTATYGAPVGSGDGNYAKYGNLFWVEGNKLRLETGSSGGGKGGQKKATPDEIYGTFAIGFGEGEIAAFGRIWCNGKLVYDPTAGTLGAKMANGDVAGNLTFYTGSATQLPDPRMQADMGAAYTPAYRGLHYIVFNDWPMADYGNTLMGVQVKAEIINSATVVQYTQPVYVPDDLLPRTASFDNTGSNDYGYFNPRFENGIFSCDKSNITVGHEWSYTFSVDMEGDIVSGGISSAPETGQFGYIGEVVAGRVTYSGSYTGWFKVGGADFLEKTSDQNNTCHGMAVGGDGRIYALVRSAGAWLFNIYDGSDLSLISSAANTALQLGDTSISNPCIPGTQVTFCVEPDGVHMWIAQQGGTVANFYTCIIASGAPTITYSYPQTFLGLYGLYSAIAADKGICCGVSSSGGFFVFDRSKTLAPTQVTLASIIQRRCLLSGLLDASDLDTSEITQSVRGSPLNGVASIRNSLEPLQGAWPFDIIPSGYQIKFKPRGASPVATIDITELGAVAGNEKIGDIMTQSREMDTQLPVKVQITYIDVNREYDKGTGPGAWRTNTDAVNVQTIDMAIVLNADEAAGIEETLLYMYWMERADFNFNLPPTWNALEAADVFTVNEPGASYEFRLVEPIYLPDGRLECLAKLNSATLYTWTAKGQEGQSTGQVLHYDGPSFMQLLDIPCLDSSIMDRPGMLAAISGYYNAWPGGVLYRSSDAGQTWNAVQSFKTPGASIGSITSVPGSGSAFVIEPKGSINVRWYQGGVSSVTDLALLNGSNFFAVGAPGRWEILGAATVVTESDGTQTLSRFLRGRFGTEQYMTTHAAGDSIVALDRSVVRFIGLDLGAINVTNQWRAVTAGKPVESASIIEQPYSGVNLKPLSPVNLNGYREYDTLDWITTWDRRSRTPVELFSGLPVPLGETSEAYEAEVWAPGFSALKRTFTGLSSPTLRYSQAQQVADFGGIVEGIDLKVYPVSSVVGRGYPLISGISRYVPLDPYVDYVICGMHMDGADNGTSFPELRGRSVTAVGGVCTKTAIKKYGSASAYFDGAGDWLEIASSTDFDFGAGDRTIDLWFYNMGAILALCSRRSSAANGWVFTTNGLRAYINGAWSDTQIYYSSPTTNAWHHYAAVKSGTTITIYIDGLYVGQITGVTSIMNEAQPIRVGGDSIAGEYPFQGYIDDFRITNYARWTSNFTPPAFSFPDS